MNLAPTGNSANDGESLETAYRSFSSADIPFGIVNVFGGEWFVDRISNDLEVRGISNPIFRPINPSSYFFNGNRPRGCSGITLVGYQTPWSFIAGNQQRNANLIDVRMIADTEESGGLVTLEGKTDTLNSAPNRERTDRLTIYGYDLRFSYALSDQSTFVGGNVFTFVTHSRENSIYTNHIFGANHIVFQKPYSFYDCIFSDNASYTYSDGSNSVTDVTFTQFKSANDNFGWGFIFENVVVESYTDTFVDYANKDLRMNPNSVGVNMNRVTGKHIGSFPVGSAVKANVAGWTLTGGVSLNGDRIETLSDGHAISPEFQLGSGTPKNQIIKVPYLDEIVDNSNGLVIDYGGNLDAPILTSPTATGLSVVLEANTTYELEGFTNVVTDVDSYPNAGYTNIRIGATPETVQSVDSNSTGTIKKVNRFDGKRTIGVKIRKVGESLPATFKPAFMGEVLYIDHLGRTNAEEGFDDSTKDVVTGSHAQIDIQFTSNYTKML